MGISEGWAIALAIPQPFVARMAELDATLALCRGKGIFATGVVRDTSNRSSRDWPWWGVAIERSEEHDLETRRLVAEIRLMAPGPRVALKFEGLWSVRVWRGLSPDRFSAKGNWALNWDTPSEGDFEAAMEDLLGAARSALADRP